MQYTSIIPQRYDINYYPYYAYSERHRRVWEGFNKIR